MSQPGKKRDLAPARRAASRRQWLRQATTLLAVWGSAGLRPGGLLKTWGAAQRTMHPRGPWTAGAFLNHEQLLLAGERVLARFAWPSLSCLETWDLPLDKISALHWEPNPGEADGGGPMVWLAGGTPGESGTWVAFDLKQHQVVAEQTLADDWLVHLVRDGQDGWLAAGRTGIVFGWQDAGWPTEVPLSDITRYEGHSGAVTGIVTFAPQTFVTASRDGSLRVWERGRAEPRRILEQHTDAVEGLLELPPAANGLPQCVSWGRDRTVRLWQPSIGRQVRLARLDAVPLVACRGVAPDELWLGCDDGARVVVSLRSVEVLAVDPGDGVPATLLLRAPDRPLGVMATARRLNTVGGSSPP